MNEIKIGRSTANSEQQKAIDATEGPVLIIARPGSGKTYTLVERIVHLVSDKAIAPEKLFVVTFTDKAAQELVTRTSNRLAESGNTLNSVYLPLSAIEEPIRYLPTGQ